MNADSHRTKRKPRHLRKGLAIIASLILAGCGRTVLVRGTVVDIAGEALPGVAVTVRGARHQVTTNAEGRYGERSNLLRCVPGVIELDFIKTGYAPARIILQANEPGAVEAGTTMLHPLPPAKGVYLLENRHYREATRVRPQRYLAKAPAAEGAPPANEGSVLPAAPVFATKNTPKIATERERPRLICYDLPAYDIRLHRLERIEAALHQQDEEETAETRDLPARYTETVWAPAQSIDLVAIPIDEPEELLLELRPGVPLAAGNYAVHWGALDGHLQPREVGHHIYLFEVRPAQEDPSPALAAGGAGDTASAADGR